MSSSESGADFKVLLEKKKSSRRGTAEVNPTRKHEVASSIPGLDQWVEDPVLLWLWCRLAAVAPMGPLAWDSHGCGPKKTTKTNQKTPQSPSAQGCN